MKHFQDQKIQAWRLHSERFNCTHEDTALRKRTVRGGAIQYVYQCLKCGEPQNQALAKAKALEANGGVEPPAFDIERKDAWNAKRDKDAEEIKERFSRGAFFESYDAYLKSPEWAKKRQLVLRRAQGVCEGCGQAEPTEVHHKTYEHVTQEFLFELVALCHVCHERIHDDKSQA
jgi:hypothetical protein